MSQRYSAVAPDSLTAFPHFCVSLATNLENSAGEVLTTTSTPPAARRRLTLSSAIVFTVAANSRSMIGAGVSLGKNSPCHEPPMSSVMPNSVVVGTLEITSTRESDVTVNARNLPAVMNGTADESVVNINCVSPEISAVTAGPAPPL